MKLQDRKDRALYTAIFVLVVLACLDLIGQLRDFLFDMWDIIWAILLPLVVSIIATYVLRPVVDALAARKVPRSLAILIIYAVVVIFMAILVINALPLLSMQIQAFIRQLPGYVTAIDGLIDRLSFATRILPDGVRVALEKTLSGAEEGLLNGVSQTLVGVKDMVSGAIQAFIVPFLVFYLLKDYSLFTALVVRLFPRRSRAGVEEIMVGIDRSLGRYVRGQLFVMLLVGVATFIGLMIVGMPYALMLSLIVALTNIIPYIGPFIGAAPALFMALGVSHVMLFKVLLVNLIVQQLEGNVFSPWIMGKTMNLHPVLILLAVMFAGEVAGVAGLIFAVPIVAVLKVIFDHVSEHAVDK
ncbi:MAG: AI-2E family transporter [Acidibacillus sp.]|uniref:Transport protein n=1 Tax=Sulfoacidibacillus ferrooxidans TaxID=2005001 RepID=A0A9X1V9D4_9BACL|nr:AI-2E family transporter [Sulfoacidibacillus ferrooxidans]MCI0181927.1 putative transport protein [Sulfoacidibacillus ferrooxidans]MCY0893411.1 AI-2E family transporter [Acidibacillus sp.]